MEHANSRQIGARSTQFKLWVAALVIAEQTKRPVAEALPKLVEVLGPTLRTTDVRGAYGFQKYYEDTIQRGRDLVQSFAGDLDPSDPMVVRLMTTLKTGEGPYEDLDLDPPLETKVEAPLVEEPEPEPLPSAKAVDSDDEFLFDDLGLPDVEDDVLAEPLSDLAQRQQEALDAYARYVTRLAKIPTIPYTRPDLGVTFFATGRFDAAGVDWNYNGQVGGDLIRDCGDNRLVFSRGMPLKAVLDFEGWSFGKDQKASGTIWIWAVQHGEGKAMRFWLNNGEDQLRFYYTMDAKGVSQVRKKPQAKGSKKFVVVDQRHIDPLKLDVPTK